MARRITGAVAVAAAALSGLTAGGPPEPPTPGPAPADATVTIYGRAGSFGALGETMPSGQRLSRRAVPGWGFPPGRQAYRTALAGDGTVLVAGRDHGVSFLPPTEPTGSELMVAAYRPATNTVDTVRVRTTTGRERVTDRAGRPAAPSVADLEPIAGGAAVAFTAWPTGADLDPATAGRWPVFGVLTNVDGRWQVAAGNQWTGDQLRGDGPGRQACPALPQPPGRGECRGLGEMATMARSHDLIVAQQTGLPGQYNGGLAALRITGPDAAGRFSVRVVGHYVYPQVKDPTTAEADDYFDIAPLAVQPDPTSAFGDERFAVSLDITNGTRRDNPPVVQEFSYDARTGAIRPVSAPLIPGDGTPLNGYGATMFDSRGNLWVARVNGLAGGKLAVYATPGRRCPIEAGRPLGSYVTSAGGRTVWGRACPPDYDILQPQTRPGALGLVEDPQSHDVVALLLGGSLLAIRPSGSGSAMTFQIGNPVDLGRKLLPLADGDFPDQRLGAIDGQHRLWLSGMRGREHGVDLRLDQWLFSVDVADLFDPEPVVLPTTPGRTATVQAEHTATTTTRRRTTSTSVQIDSDAYFSGCSDVLPGVDCASDDTPGEGFVLSDDSRYGHLGGAVDYRVSVARPGTYRVGYRVATFAVTTRARIQLSTGDRSYTTTVSTGGGWSTIWQEEPITLAAGVHRLRLSVPAGGGGWYLNAMTVKRV